MEASLARTLLRAAPMAVMAVDEAGRVRLANPKADAMWGRDLAADATLLGDLLPGFDLEVHFAEGQGSEPAPLRTEIDGLPRDLSLSAVRFEAPGTHLVALFIRDDTDRIRAEDALQKVRTEIIMNWRLNSLGELAALVGHEINQPLAAMTTLVHIVREEVAGTALRPDVVEALDGAIAQAQRAADIIRRFRALLSRQTRFHADVSARRLVEEIEPLLRLQARDVGLSLQIEVEDAPLSCDSVQIQQVLMNLFRNACMHGRAERHAMVLITGETDGSVYRYAVADNGPGFKSAAGLFEPHAGDGAGGMGLGLSISRRIVEAHSGVISADNRRDGGARISFEIPIGDGA